MSNENGFCNYCGIRNKSECLSATKVVIYMGLYPAHFSSVDRQIVGFLEKKKKINRFVCYISSYEFKHFFLFAWQWLPYGKRFRNILSRIKNTPKNMKTKNTAAAFSKQTMKKIHKHEANKLMVSALHTNKLHRSLRVYIRRIT